MTIRYILSAALAAVVLSAGGTAQAHGNDNPCRDYTRTLYFSGNVTEDIHGTACLGGDGAWRVTFEDRGGNRIGAVISPPPETVVRETVAYEYRRPVVTQVVYVPAWRGRGPHHHRHHHERHGGDRDWGYDRDHDRGRDRHDNGRHRGWR